MADISTITVNGNLYDIKDSVARNGDAAQIVCIWDGNIDGLDGFSPDTTYSYYRVSDAIKMSNDQMLIGNSSTLHIGLIMSSSSSSSTTGLDSEFTLMAMMPTLLGVNLGPANMIDSSCNMQEQSAFGQICIDMFGSSATPELEAELRELSNVGIQLGLNLQSRLMMYINAPQECTLVHLANFLYGIESLTIPAGLWLAKLENPDDPDQSAFIDTMYLASPQLSKVINIGLSTIFMMINNGMLSNASLFNTSTTE